MPSSKEIFARSGDKRLPIQFPGSRLAAPIGPAIILLLSLVLSPGSELFSGNVIGSTHLDNDLGNFSAHRKIAFYGDSSFPFWNLYLMCGVPLIAEIQSGLFYPPNIVFQYRPKYFSASIVVALITLLSTCDGAVFIDRYRGSK